MVLIFFFMNTIAKPNVKRLTDNVAEKLAVAHHPIALFFPGQIQMLRHDQDLQNMNLSDAKLEYSAYLKLKYSMKTLQYDTPLAGSLLSRGDLVYGR